MLSTFHESDDSMDEIDNSQLSLSIWTLFFGECVIKWMSSSGSELEQLDDFIKLNLALILNVVQKVFAVGFLK